MKRFVAPPNWPIRSRRNWIPPKTWRPDPSWPPAPEGWQFWVDSNGKAVLGPIGRYGGPSRRAAYAGGAALLVFLGVNVWAVFMIGLFGGGPDDPAVVTFAAESPSASPALGSASPVVPRTAATPPRTVPVPEEGPTSRSTWNATPRPRTSTAIRITERTTPKPMPTKTRTTSVGTVTPSRPTGRPSTREELLRQYCIDRGIDPSWCEPDTWQQRHP